MKYGGHKNWNHWSVHLWLTGTESLYRMALWEVERSRTLDWAAKNILHNMLCRRGRKGVTLSEGYVLSGEYGQHVHTPDGAPYTVTSIRAAIVGWKD